MANRAAMSGATYALAAMLMVVGAPAFAALSPYYQSITEIGRMLSDPRLQEAFQRQEAIISISLTAPDIYEVKTTNCTVNVNVVDAPREPGKPAIIGPRQFDLRFGAARCK
jgi:hypothetical protein